MKKNLSVILTLVLALCLAGCNNTDTTFENKVQSGVTDVYADKTVGFQLEAPAVGEKIAVMHTSMGDISIRFFPEAAPKAVQNFLTHAENGYYDGLTFHRVMEDFMIQGGDPDGDGSGGESIWNKDFEDEFDKKLLNLRGSLAMANAGVNTNGSQFFINQADADAFAGRDEYAYTAEDLAENIAELEEQYAQLLEAYGEATVLAYYGSLTDVLNSYLPTYVYDAVPDEVWDLYEQYGGNFHLDGPWRRSGGHTVFGQVFAGMDVVDAIAAVETDSNNKPSTAVTIISIDVMEYAG